MSTFTLARSTCAFCTRPNVVSVSLCATVEATSNLFTMSAWMQYFKAIPTHMDYDGQARAEKLSRIIITLFGAVGLIWGYVIQQFSQTIYILGAGFLMAALITVPPWPMYRRKPLEWQKPHSEVTTKLRKKK